MISTSRARNCRLESELREPRDARRLGLTVLSDYPRRTARPPVTPPADSVAGEEHTIATIEQKGHVPAGVTRGMERHEIRHESGPSPVQRLVHGDPLRRRHDRCHDSHEALGRRVFRAGDDWCIDGMSNDACSGSTT